MRIKNRDELGYALSAVGLNGVGVELGVFEGEYSKKLLETWDGNKLISVDAWTPIEGSSGYSHSKRDHDVRYMRAVIKLCGFSKNIILKLESEPASQFFGYKGLDFIYIDASHDYEGVKRDIELWAPKVKDGGWVCGHDWWDGTKESVGVTRAVKEFAGDREIVITEEPEYPRSWVVMI